MSPHQDVALDVPWDSAGLVQLYTPAMLAELVGVPAAVVRRWHKRGWLIAARQVRRLPYFDFQEVATARRLAELQAAGATPAAIAKYLSALSRYLPHIERPLAQLPLVVEGKHLLVRQGDELVEPTGQLRFDFGTQAEADCPPEADAQDVVSIESIRNDRRAGHSPAELVLLAGELEDEGRLGAAAEMLRAAIAAGGPMSEISFMLAEVLYQLGDLAAARERYYVAIELDEDYVEARANLGCVLSETGEHELAAAAFEGALAFHPDYADAHYHLARTLDELGRSHDADAHWRSFLRLAPDSPWADEAHLRLE